MVVVFVPFELALSHLKVGSPQGKCEVGKGGGMNPLLVQTYLFDNCLLPKGRAVWKVSC